MKKYSVAAAMIALSMGSFAQKANIKATENALYEPMDLAEARKSIEPAMTNPETSNQAKTFNLAGKTYFLSYEENNKAGKKAVADNKEYLVKSVDSYFKAYKLDQAPNEKGKVSPKFSKDIKNKLTKIQDYLYNEGYFFFSEQDYNSAYVLWSKYLEIPNSDAFAGTPKDSTYYTIYSYAIEAARNDENLKKKEAVAMMEEFKNFDHKEAANMYNMLYISYMEVLGDTAKAIKTTLEGVQKYPNNERMLANLINAYLLTEQSDEAIKYLDQAIAKNPKDAQFYLLKGESYRKLLKYDEAISAYNSAIAIDPNKPSAYIGVGACYMLKGEEYNNEADKIPTKQKAKYEAAVKKVKDEYQKAVDPLEKAHIIDPKNRSTLSLLRNVYMRLNQGAKADAIKKEMDKL